MAKPPVDAPDSTRTKGLWANAGKWLNYAVSGVVGAALVGLVAKWIETRHKEVAARIDDQISKLYQPFYSASRENDMAWCVFVEGTWHAASDDRPRCGDPTKAYWTDVTMPDSDVERWRSRMASVFQPSNQSMIELIQQNRSQLIDGEEPPLWQVFSKHTFAYKGLMAEWKPDDNRMRHEHFHNVRFNVVEPQYPGSLSLCSRKILDVLQAERRRIDQNLFVVNDPKIVYPAECDVSSQRLGSP